MSDISDDFQFAPDASEADINALVAALRKKIPHDYPREIPHNYYLFLLTNDGGEGFVGDHYFILWRAADLMRYNEAYEVTKYAPGLFLFGSNGGGEAYAFDLRDPAVPIVTVPFVGLSLEYAEVFAENFEQLLAEFQRIAEEQSEDEDDEDYDDEDSEGDDAAAEPSARPRDREVWDIKPILLGGDPEDPANKTSLDREKHIQAVRYWNKVISDLRAKQG